MPAKIPHITLPTGEVGKVCTKCNEAKPLDNFGRHGNRGFRPQCKPCRSQSDRDYRKAHPEKRWEPGAERRKQYAEYQKAYRAVHEEDLRSRRLTDAFRKRAAHNQATRRKQKPECFVSANHKHYSKHKEKIFARRKELRATNLAIHRLWSRVSAQRRRARKRLQGGTFTAQEFVNLCARYGNQCLCCLNNAPLEADHVVPLSKGGSNDIGNIQPLCKSCNSRKQTKTVDYRFDRRD